ncbi:MAG: 30S ribosomal protein S6--L-glutamate ligase [Planctomycetota bacterium]
MKIAILSRNNALYSTTRLVESARERGHEPMVVDFTKCYVSMERGKPDVFYGGKSLRSMDAVIPRVGSSVTFFGTAVVRQFEMMKIFCTNTSSAILNSRDKLSSLQILSREGVGIPKTIFASFPKDKDVERLISHIGGVPLIVKLLEGTQGLGVVLADTNASAKSVVEAFSKLEANILIQEFIREARGSDVRAFVVDGEVVGCMKRQSADGEFRANLHRGGLGVEVDLTSEEKTAAVNAAKAMGLSVAGVDILQSSRGPLILEVNSSPGLKGIEGATRKDIASTIIQYIERSVERGPG